MLKEEVEDTDDQTNWMAIIMNIIVAGVNCKADVVAGTIRVLKGFLIIVTLIPVTAVTIIMKPSQGYLLKSSWF